MKKRGIEQTIEKKIDAWIETIKDENVKNLVKNNTIVTGGCIVSMLLDERINDFDLYFRNEETVKAVSDYYVKLFKERFKVNNLGGLGTQLNVISTDGRVKIVAKSVGVVSEESENFQYEYFEGSEEGSSTRYVEGITSTQEESIEKQIDLKETVNPQNDGSYRPIFLSSNAVTLSDRVQLIIRFFGEPDEIHKNYDFTHCTNYWTSWDRKLVLNQDALESILTKELKYQGSKYPICSLIRLRKFIARGWNIHAGQILKMVFQVNELDLKDPKILEDQLVGVDAAYFSELIKKVKEGGEKVNSAYVVELIEKLDV